MRNCRGLTLIELIVCVAVAGLAAALVVGAAQPEADRAAKIARCADNLRLLAAANHCYADDFGEKFFYNWASGMWVTGEYRSDTRRYWHDKERVGRYLVGEPLIWRMPNPNVKAAPPPVGLGGGIFVCPSDEGGARSYSQNFWAAGIDPPDTWAGNQWGRFFDRNAADHLSRLILFGEMMGLMPTQDGRWATFGDIGGLERPGATFGGRPPGIFAVDHRDALPFRWKPAETYPSILDYGRHGEFASREKAQGILNFAYADGHVAARAHSDLYDPVTLKSTFDSLWSPIDLELDK